MYANVHFPHNKVFIRRSHRDDKSTHQHYAQSIAIPQRIKWFLVLCRCDFCLLFTVFVSRCLRFVTIFPFSFFFFLRAGLESCRQLHRLMFHRRNIKRYPSSIWRVLNKHSRWIISFSLFFLLLFWLAGLIFSVDHPHSLRRLAVGSAINSKTPKID